METPTRERADLEYVRDQGRLKTARDAVMLRDTARVLASDQAIADAHSKLSLGDEYKPPEDDEVIHVGDVTIQYAPPAEQAKPAQAPQSSPPPQATPPQPAVPSWLKSALLVAAAAAAGAGVPALWRQMQGQPGTTVVVPSGVDTDTDTDTQYKIGLSQE